LPKEKPLFTADQQFPNTIETGQGINYRPRSPLSYESEGRPSDRSNVIWVKTGDKENAAHYIRDLLTLVKKGNFLND